MALAVLQFDLDLADVNVVIGRIDTTGIEREFDLALADGQKHRDAVDVGLEDGLKLMLDLAAKKRSQRGFVSQLQLRLISLDALLPLVPSNEGSGCGLDRLEPLVADPSHPQAHSVIAQR